MEKNGGSNNNIFLLLLAASIAYGYDAKHLSANVVFLIFSV